MRVGIGVSASICEHPLRRSVFVFSLETAPVHPCAWCGVCVVCVYVYFAPSVMPSVHRAIIRCAQSKKIIHLPQIELGRGPLCLLGGGKAGYEVATVDTPTQITTTSEFRRTGPVSAWWAPKSINGKAQAASPSAAYSRTQGTR